MRILYTTLSLAPAPLFFLGFLWSILNITHTPVCGSHSWEMPIMWFVMALAHLTPWLMWRQQRNFTRN
jgi:hypothetical protein